MEIASVSRVNSAYFRARGHIPSPLRHFCFCTIFLDLSLATTISVLETCVAKEYACNSIQTAWDERVNCRLVPRPHFSSRSKRFGSRGPCENVFPARWPRIRHRNELTERDWENAVQGLGKVNCCFGRFFFK